MGRIFRFSSRRSRGNKKLSSGVSSDRGSCAHSCGSAGSFVQRNEAGNLRRFAPLRVLPGQFPRSTGGGAEHERARHRLLLRCGSANDRGGRPAPGRQHGFNYHGLRQRRKVAGNHAAVRLRTPSAKSAVSRFSSKNGQGQHRWIPRPHRYFFPRDYTTNLGYVWYTSWRGHGGPRYPAAAR